MHLVNKDHFLADFQTEEELQSHLTASYQKAVAEGIPSSVCAQNMIMAIKTFLKIQDAKEKEVGKSMWAGLLLIWKNFLLFWATSPSCSLKFYVEWHHSHWLLPSVRTQ